jgi:two-component system cell cycle response regulator
MSPSRDFLGGHIPAGPNSEAPYPPHSSVKRVLVAEDDPVFRRVLLRWLNSWSYTVESAEDGQSAWDMLKRPDAPALVILDWMMPVLDGIEVCRRIRGQATPYRYVLLLTARDSKEDLIVGFEAGADDYLTKPFHAEELRARIRVGQRILDLQDALLDAQQALRFEARHDRLTNICNRGAIIDCLIAELQRRRRSKEPLGVIMADIDHFKVVNDTHGHLVGDKVLSEVARRLSLVVRSYDRAGRYGGEEFLIVVPGCDASGLARLAERLRLAVSRKPIETNAGAFPVTISLGLAFVPLGDESVTNCEDLLRRADDALYAAKRNGRNRVETSTLARAAQAGE